MSGIGRGLLTRRVREVVATRQHPSYFNLPSSTSSQCLLHPPPPSFHSQTRHLTLSLSRQSCLDSASSSRPLTPSASLSRPLQPSASLPLSFPATSLHLASFSTSPPLLKTRPKVDGGPPEEKKRRQDKSAFITLIDIEDKVSAISLDKAERLARRRDLKLVKIEDPSMGKSGNEVYKLMTGKQYFEEEVKTKKSEKKSSAGAKEEKILAIGGKITPHDLGVKLHSLAKWLSKGHQIKVTITSRKATKEDVDSVFSTIEEEVKKIKGRILQRHEKMEDVRFYIAPAKDKESVGGSETTDRDDHVHSEESSDHTKG